MKAIDLRKLVEDLHGIDSKRVYCELFITAVVAWSCYFALFLDFVSSIKIILYLISSIAFYRGLSFIHEVAHFDNTVPHFRLVYNTLFGVPCRVPSYSLRTHKYHHGIKTFATLEDPEYERWTQRKAYFLLRPFILSFFYPLFLTIRFTILPLFYPLMSLELKKNIYQKMSSFVMNLKYKRPFSPDEYSQMQAQDTACALYFIIFVILTTYFGVFKYAYGIWYAQIMFISLMNTYRALVAHRYQAHQADPSTTPRDLQINDSVTIEGSFLTEIWAPIGLRYHSTHHMFPSIPYYNLAHAHKRLKAAVDIDHPYSKTIDPSFIVAFTKLVASCK